MTPVFKNKTRVSIHGAPRRLHHCCSCSEAVGADAEARLLSADARARDKRTGEKSLFELNSAVATSDKTRETVAEPCVVVPHNLLVLSLSLFFLKAAGSIALFSHSLIIFD